MASACYNLGASLNEEARKWEGRIPTAVTTSNLEHYLAGGAEMQFHLTNRFHLGAPCSTREPKSNSAQLWC